MVSSGGRYKGTSDKTSTPWSIYLRIPEVIGDILRLGMTEGGRSRMGRESVIKKKVREFDKEREGCSGTIYVKRGVEEDN